MTDHGMAPREFRWLRCHGVDCGMEFRLEARVMQCENCGRWYTLHIHSDQDGELPVTAVFRAERMEQLQTIWRHRGQTEG